MEGFAERFISANFEELGERAPLLDLFQALPVPPTLSAALQLIKGAIRAGLIRLDLEELESLEEICLDFARNKVAEGDRSIPEHFIACITLYSSEFPSERSLYTVVNELLRDADPTKLHPVVPFVWLLMNALNKCPSFEGALVFRGVKGIPPGTYTPGQIVTWLQFSSCACSVEVQQTFLGQAGRRTLFTIELTTGRGREIHQYSLFEQEKEVLLPANTRLEVVAIFEAGAGLTHVQLREVASLDPILVFTSQEGEHVIILAFFVPY